MKTSLWFLKSVKESVFVSLCTDLLLLESTFEVVETVVNGLPFLSRSLSLYNLAGWIIIIKVCVSEVKRSSSNWDARLISCIQFSQRPRKTNLWRCKTCDDLSSVNHHIQNNNETTVFYMLYSRSSSGRSDLLLHLIDL